MKFIKLNERMVNLERVNYLEKEGQCSITFYFAEEEWVRLEYSSTEKRDEVFQTLIEDL